MKNNNDTKDNKRKLMNTIFVDKAFQYILYIFLVIALINRLQGLAAVIISVLLFVYLARIWSKLGKKKVYYNFEAESKRIFPDEDFSISFQVVNKKILPIWIKIKFDDFMTKLFDIVSEQESNLLWYQKVKWNLTAKSKKRGWYLLKPSVLKIGDPFGFYEEEIDTSNKTVEIIVYPEIFNFEIPSFFKKELMGNTYDKKGLVKDPIYFSGIREYQQRKPARFINWKATARYNSLKEMVFDASTELKVIFLLDAANFEKSHNQFEKALSTIASIAVKLADTGFSFGIISNGKLAGKLEGKYVSMLPSNSDKNLSRLLEVLARLKPEYEYEIDTIIKNNHISTNTTFLNFFYQWDEINSKVYMVKNKNYSMINIICSPQNNNNQLKNLYQLSELIPSGSNYSRKKEGVN